MANLDVHKVAFPALDDIHVATLGKFGTRRVLRDGEHLFKAGDREYKFFVVERGAVEIVEHSTGETKRVTLHERHEFGGDVSLVTGRPALVSAIARGDTEVFEIAPGNLRRIMREVRQDKVSAKFAIDPREQVQIERRGDSRRVIVGQQHVMNRFLHVSS